MRPSIIAMIFMSFSVSVGADVRPADLMGSSSILCSAYLRLAPDSPERQRLNYWVSGRIVAIIPASVQPYLRKQPWSRLEGDLEAYCREYGGEDLFIASAILAHEYKCEAGKHHHPAC